VRNFAGTEAQRWISTAVRLGLATVLFWSGGAKVSDPKQAVTAVQAYQILPPHVGEFVGYALPLLELSLAVALLVGVATRLTAIFAGALMTAFVIGVISVWARGLSIDCGCFGGGGEVVTGQAHYLPVVLRDTGFTLLAAWLVVFPASHWALDRRGEAGIGGLGLYDELDEDDEIANEESTAESPAEHEVEYDVEYDAEDNAEEPQR
jgi:uncharacterized membrane protein YphA (DoxX/SURF4 family)